MYVMEILLFVLASTVQPFFFSNIHAALNWFKPYSGSANNLISQDESKNLQTQGLKIELQLCSKKLDAYGGQNLEVVGHFKSELAVEETKVLTQFIVVKRGRSLVRYSTAT